MFLHVGNSKNIRERDIIGIFDTDNATFYSRTTKKYLSDAEKRGEVETAGEDIPKSFVLYRIGKDNDKENSRDKKRKYGYKICFSVLSTSALLGRLGNGQP